jgi:hypothetical protein
MDYLYENLGEDRFQELCQSLLIREFPQVQCFPVRQPDGGRDAVSYLDEYTDKKTFSVFQVKFVRKPQAEKDPHGWFEKTLSLELPKLTKLVPKGAKAYHLLTNVPGTAHGETGSIDKVNRALSALPVPAFCWWRDDLNQRLDTAFDLKWLYPQLLTGTDMLRLLVEQALSGDRERRTSAIRAFVRAQYEEDREVRFKQVELQNDLLTLFVDVPIGMKRGLGDRNAYYLRNLAGEPSESDEEGHIGHAATVLLNQNVRRVLEQVVIEGAPGQGKSTITQYICQVHRILLLGDNSQAQKIPNLHLPQYRCIPIKVDLRDLASWLNKKDPFSPDESVVPQNWIKSLESFLAALIRHHSGGAEFTVSDLHAVSQLSSLLLVLDGLDEVADLPRRKDVIQEVSIGVCRLRETAASLQVIVTSRPTAFGPALGFNEKQFPHLELRSLSQALIMEYAEKWLVARHLKPSEASTVRRILKQKIAQRHLRDLTRNPMQLTILLSLIHTRGSSLPEKRTALYDGYVELFFNRESEKSEIVREHRDLLIDLHRHLAWVLHSEAEINQLRGSISSERLHKLLSAYLAGEQRTESSVTDLFKGMVERIVFLVSRVQGTFEFEVQPLREYFAAKHLYETAPYSPPGREQQGTKPDRFDAIAQNPYWLNVTRFFAGCFSKGELSCLADRLEFLAQREKPNCSYRQRRLASFLLRDWVFSQDQRSTQRAVALVLDGVGLRHPRQAKGTFSPLSQELVLPPGCGRDELVAKCISTLQGKPKLDIAHETAHLLVANSTPDLIDGVWSREFAQSTGGEITRWLRYGLFMGSLSRADNRMLMEKFTGAAPTLEQLTIIHSSGQMQFIHDSASFTQTLVDGVLSGIFRSFRNPSDAISRLSLALQPSRYLMATRHAGPMPLREILKHREPTWEAPSKPLSVTNNPSWTRCEEFLNRVETEIDRQAFEWAANLDPWRVITEKGRELWGERPAFFEIANLAADCNAFVTNTADFENLLDSSRPLCDRVWHAKHRSGAPTWWRAQFESATSDMDILLVSMTAISWVGSKTLYKLLAPLDECLLRMSGRSWGIFSSFCNSHIYSYRMRRRVKMDISALPGSLGERTVFALATRCALIDEQSLYRRYFSRYEGKDGDIAAFCLRTALSFKDTTPDLWREILRLLKGGSLAGAARDPYYHFRGTKSLSQAMPLEFARAIAVDQKQYPRAWVYAAVERCELDIASKVEAVGAIASKEQWFRR